MFDFVAQHKLSSTFIIILIILAAWYGLNSSSSSSSSSSLATSTPVGGGPGGDLVNTLLTLRTVNLNGTIFSDPLFLTFKDFTTPIVPEAVGRPNPFAPLSQSVLQSATSSATRNPALFAPKK